MPFYYVVRSFGPDTVNDMCHCHEKCVKPTNPALRDGIGARGDVCPILGNVTVTEWNYLRKIILFLVTLQLDKFTTEFLEGSFQCRARWKRKKVILDDTKDFAIE